MNLESSIAILANLVAILVAAKNDMHPPLVRESFRVHINYIINNININKKLWHLNQDQKELQHLPANQTNDNGITKIHQVTHLP